MHLWWEGRGSHISGAGELSCESFEQHGWTARRAHPGFDYSDLWCECDTDIWNGTTFKEVCYNALPHIAHVFSSVYHRPAFITSYLRTSSEFLQQYRVQGTRTKVLRNLRTLPSNVEPLHDWLRMWWLGLERPLWVWSVLTRFCWWPFPIVFFYPVGGDILFNPSKSFFHHGEIDNEQEKDSNLPSFPYLRIIANWE